ncbi:MAG: efflux RND transporter periplasmic adaptor subunit [Chloroflexota bacterium]|nr:MAG: efflux RND transporter periplasmic adaptor subunit [Chloroflexota bacterium]
MKQSKLWFGWILIVVVALGLSACSGNNSPEKIEPAELVDQGDGRNLVILTEKAAERLGIQTETVSEEEIALTRTFGGEVMEASENGGAKIMVSLTRDEMNTVDLNGSAFVIPLHDDDPEDEDNGDLPAELDETPGMDDPEENPVTALYYTVAGGGSNLVSGQRLKVRVPLKGDEGPRLVVPFSSLIYDINGGTWVYINPESLQYLRVPVTVDYVKGDQVVLTEGPSVGTAVVTVGVAELHGADTGVGK